MIPVINMSDPDDQNLIQSISNASQKWGIFQVVNHNIPTKVLSDVQTVGAAFFQLPRIEKDKYAMMSGSLDGYGVKFREGWGEHIFHRISLDYRVDDLSLWPRDPPEYQAAVLEYVKYSRAVAEGILWRLSVGLGLESRVLCDALGGESISPLFKINYYPPIDPNIEVLPKFGVASHTDLSALTILVPNQVPGLQVLSNDGDRWIDVDYIPNALIIHIGDQIEIASNGFYKSVVHRAVVDKEKTRLSWPVFYEPPPDFVVGPIPQLLNEQISPKYESNKFKDYAYKKFTSVATISVSTNTPAKT